MAEKQRRERFQRRDGVGKRVPERTSTKAEGLVVRRLGGGWGVTLALAACTDVRPTPRAAATVGESVEGTRAPVACKRAGRIYVHSLAPPRDHSLVGLRLRRCGYSSAFALGPWTGDGATSRVSTLLIVADSSSTREDMKLAGCIAAAAVLQLLVATTATPQDANALAQYQMRIPNGAFVPGAPGVGHSNPAGGGSLNPFGRDFQRAGHKWTAALCQKDSDGDGLSNGEELGDPTCVWKPGKTPTRTTGITHPGFKEGTTLPPSTPGGGGDDDGDDDEGGEHEGGEHEGHGGRHRRKQRHGA